TLASTRRSPGRVGLSPSDDDVTVSDAPHAVHLRGRQFLLLVGATGVLGVAAAILTLGFLWTEHGLQHLLWESLPEKLGVDPHPWYALAVMTLGGLAVGLVLRFVPGHGGPGPARATGSVSRTAVC